MRSFVGLNVLVAMTVVQTIMATGIIILPTIAPIVAAALAIDPAWVGMQVSLLYGCSMISAFFCGRLVARHGSCRVSQVALALMATGCIFASLPSFSAIALGSVLMGLGYGLPVPAASRLLLRFTDPSKRNIVFSLKQSGVPLGGLIAGVTAPGLASVFAWQAPLLICALLCLVLICWLQGRRALWDDDRRAAPDPDRWAGFATIRASRLLRWLALTVLIMSIVQLCIVTFTVAALVGELSFSPIHAGFILAAVQAASMAARIGWGWIADVAGDGIKVLIALFALLAAALMAGAMLTPSSPVVVVVALFLILGITAVGWNGVLMAECARLSPEGRIADVTALVMVGTYLGVLCGPAAFALLQMQIGGVIASFPVLAALTAAGIASLLVARRA